MADEAGDFFDIAKWQRTRARVPDPVAVTLPKQLAVWSKTSARDGGRFLHGDRSGLLTFRAPPLPANLNDGFPDRYTTKSEGAASPVDTIVTAACGAGVDWAAVSVCTYRNNLNKILMTPLSPRDGWTIDACLVGGTLFLDIVKAGADTKSWPGQERMCYYGYKFEALCTGDGDDVDATSEFSCVVRYRLGRHRVVMGAEIDAELADDAPEAGAGAAGAGAGGAAAGGAGGAGGEAAAPGGQQQQGQGQGQQQQGQAARPRYVELKCYKIPGHPRAEATIYSQKHPRWWVQSFLAGVGHLALGGRDEAGVLRRVHTVRVVELPELSARAGQPWDANVLLRFGDECLAWMAARAAAAGEGVQLRFEHDPARRGVACARAPGGGMAARLRPLLTAAGGGGGGGGGGGAAEAEPAAV